MIADIRALLDRFAVENSATAAELREFLSADQAGRQQAVAGMVAGFQALLGQIAAGNQTAAVELRTFLDSDRQARSAATASFMATTHANRQAMAEALADRLDQFKDTLKATVSGSLAGFVAERSELRRTLDEVAQLWHAFAAAMAGGSPQPAEPAVTAAPPPAPAPPVEEVDVADQILAYLTGHPAGAKLVDMEPTFGLARPQLGKLLRHLVDSGKVVKDPETLVYTLAEGSSL
jgi:hypothetical protein